MGRLSDGLFSCRVVEALNDKIKIGDREKREILYGAAEYFDSIINIMIFLPMDNHNLFSPEGLSRFSEYNKIFHTHESLSNISDSDYLFGLEILVSTAKSLAENKSVEDKNRNALLRYFTKLSDMKFNRRYNDSKDDDFVHLGFAY